ncbi:hypothetical protein JB92DRAFT_3109124 [Gautieria morchelliformis]|nr:hypothetical protein JB92DRAFT_3109124 [Gautieria morchelliformis]
MVLEGAGWRLEVDDGKRGVNDQRAVLGNGDHFVPDNDMARTYPCLGSKKTDLKFDLPILDKRRVHIHQVMSRLESAPREIIEEIAFRVALVSSLGPPSHLPPFLRLSRRIHSIVNIEDNPLLYARIFRSRFDIRAVWRRFDDQFACAGIRRTNSSVDVRGSSVLDGTLTLFTPLATSKTEG